MDLVLGVRRYMFWDTQGKEIKGLKVFYLGEQEDTEDSKGRFPIAITADYLLFEKFVKLPGYYHLDFRTRPDNKGNPRLILVDATYNDTDDVTGDLIQERLRNV